jgi:hypothetical protein
MVIEALALVLGNMSKKPSDYYHLFWNDAITKKIVAKTNIYSNILDYNITKQLICNLR